MSNPVDELAASKGLPATFLHGLGLREVKSGIAIPYRNTAGDVVFERVRTPAGSEPRFRQPAGQALVPYGRERLSQARKAGYLYLCEGESDTWVMWLLGLPALGLPGSNTAGSLGTDDLALIDRVITLPDNDPGGATFHTGVDRVLRSMTWPGELVRGKVPERYKDVSDWHAAEGQRVRACLEGLVRPSRKDARAEEATIVCLADVQSEPVRWLWPGWLPQGALTVLDGDPGLGKSTMTLDMAARVSRGWSFPPLEGKDFGRQPAGVLLLGAEDSLSHTVRPRLDAAGADVERIFSLESIKLGDDKRVPSLPADLHLISAVIKANGIKFLVIDPLMAYLGPDVDAHKDQHVRRCLNPLATLAEDFDVTVLLLRHLNKLSGGPALYRGGSSIGITGASRASLIVGRDPRSDGYVLAMNKINLGPRPTSLAYHIETVGNSCRILWDAESDLGPNDILGHPAGRRPDQPSDLEEAQEFLANILSSGPISANDVYTKADAAEHSRRSLERAKKDLGVRSRKEGKLWLWELPPAGKEGTPPTLFGDLPEAGDLDLPPDDPDFIPFN